MGRRRMTPPTKWNEVILQERIWARGMATKNNSIEINYVFKARLRKQNKSVNSVSADVKSE